MQEICNGEPMTPSTFIDLFRKTAEVQTCEENTIQV